MVSTDILAAVVTLIGSGIIATIGWGVGYLKRELEESRKARETEHEWVRRMVVSNYKTTRNIARALDRSDGIDVEVSVGDHPLEERQDDYSDL